MANISGIVDISAPILSGAGLILLAVSLVWWLFLKKKMRLALTYVTWIIVILCIIGIIALALVGDTLQRMGMPAGPYVWSATGAFILMIGAYFLFVTYMYSKIETGSGYTLVSAYMFGGIHEKLNSMYGSAAASHIIYAIGKGAGYKEAKNLFEVMAKGNKKKIVKALKSSLGIGMVLAGYSRKSEIVAWGPGERVVIRTKGAVETVGGRSAKEPGCHLARGLISGMGEAAYPFSVCEVNENKCESKGDPYCEFEMNWFEKIKPEEIKGAGIKTIEEEKIEAKAGAGTEKRKRGRPAKAKEANK